MSIKEQVSEVLELLYSRFPKTFFAYQVRRRPLKLGIHQDLAALLGIEQKLIRKALGTYVTNHGYVRAQQAGAERIDLDGNSAGVVTAEEVEKAKQRLAGINARRKPKKKRPEQKQKSIEPKPEPKRDGLASLREAAAARRQRQAAAGGGA